MDSVNGQLQNWHERPPQIELKKQGPLTYSTAWGDAELS